MTEPPREPVVMESGKYAEARKKLKEDPIIQQMAQEVAIEMASPENREVFVHDSGRPRFNFMNGSNREYAKRGGKHIAHIGGVAEAILELVEQMPKGDDDA